MVFKKRYAGLVIREGLILGAVSAGGVSSAAVGSGQEGLKRYPVIAAPQDPGEWQRWRKELVALAAAGKFVRELF